MSVGVAVGIRQSLQLKEAAGLQAKFSTPGAEAEKITELPGQMFEIAGEMDKSGGFITVTVANAVSAQTPFVETLLYVVVSRGSTTIELRLSAVSWPNKGVHLKVILGKSKLLKSEPESSTLDWLHTLVSKGVTARF